MLFLKMLGAITELLNNLALGVTTLGNTVLLQSQTTKILE